MYQADVAAKLAYGNQAQGYVGMDAEVGLIRRPSLVEKMESQLSDAKKEVSRLEELTALLKQNPEFNRILELLGRNY